jgi:hypothetical protein
MLAVGFGEGGASPPPYLFDAARVDLAAAETLGAKPARGLRGVLCQVPSPWAQIPSEPLHELQHFSLNAISVVAIFTVVCEGYLGVIPYWELWLHLFRGELFHAPSRTARVRKLVRAGCLNLVQNTGQQTNLESTTPLG